MLNNRVVELLNDQVNKEFYSAYLYLDFANYYHDKSLDGFANWYEIQAKEEMDHAMLMVKFLQNNDHSVKLEAIAKPNVELKEFIDPLNEALKHEKYVTSLINNIYEVALETKDYRAQKFLSWFIDEQGEEEFKKLVDEYSNKYNNISVKILTTKFKQIIGIHQLINETLFSIIVGGKEDISLKHSIGFIRINKNNRIPTAA